MIDLAPWGCALASARAEALAPVQPRPAGSCVAPADDVGAAPPPPPPPLGVATAAGSVRPAIEVTVCVAPLAAPLTADVTVPVGEDPVAADGLGATDTCVAGAVERTLTDGEGGTTALTVEREPPEDDEVGREAETDVVGEVVVGSDADTEVDGATVTVAVTGWDGERPIVFKTGGSIAAPAPPAPKPHTTRAARSAGAILRPVAIIRDASNIRP